MSVLVQSVHVTIAAYYAAIPGRSSSSAAGSVSSGTRNRRGNWRSPLRLVRLAPALLRRGFQLGSLVDHITVRAQGAIGDPFLPSRSGWSTTTPSGASAEGAAPPTGTGDDLGAGQIVGAGQG